MLLHCLTCSTAVFGILIFVLQLVEDHIQHFTNFHSLFPCLRCHPIQALCDASHSSCVHISFSSIRHALPLEWAFVITVGLQSFRMDQQYGALEDCEAYLWWIRIKCISPGISKCNSRRISLSKTAWLRSNSRGLRLLILKVDISMNSRRS